MQQTQKEELKSWGGGTALPMYIKSLQTSQPVSIHIIHQPTTCALAYIFNYQQLYVDPTRLYLIGTKKK